jgi:hypothetical protein
MFTKEKRKNSMFRHLWLPLGGSNFSLRTQPRPSSAMDERTLKPIFAFPFFFMAGMGFMAMGLVMLSETWWGFIAIMLSFGCFQISASALYRLRTQRYHNLQRFKQISSLLNQQTQK